MNVFHTFLNGKVFIETLPLILSGLSTTLLLGATSIVIGMALGLVLALVRLYADRVSRALAIETAQRAEVIIYAISTDDSGLILRGDKALQQIADATGGRAFFPFKMKDIKNSFAAIEDELRSQYVVSYKPADFDADGRYRSIEITALKKDLQVRARKGYYAPRQ